MSRYTCRIISSCAVCVCLSAACLAESGPRQGSTVMIVPARYRMLQLAFDMNWLKSVPIMSYRGSANTTPLLYLWTGSDWRHIGADDFSAGRFIDPPPAVVILVGDDNALPRALVEGIAWDCKVERLETFEIAELLNRLNIILKFSDKELELLAQRYNLNLEDIYAKERAINPYEIRRSELPVKIQGTKALGDEVEPAVIMEEREVEGVPLLEEIDR